MPTKNFNPQSVPKGTSESNKPLWGAIRNPQWVDSRWKEIGRFADRIGVRAYAVGGCVRDLLLNVDNKDLDIAVEGSPERLAKALAGAWKGRIIRHERFGTASVESSKGRVDLAMTRTETYAHPGALPEVRSATLAEDLFRRDVTINAMAVSLNAFTWGALVDPAGGREDLVARRVRVLHALSFLDDPTRWFRAVRYEQRYGLAIELVTRRWLNEAVKAGAADTVSTDRWHREWELVFREDQPWNILRRLSDLGVLAKFGFSGDQVVRARPRFTSLACRVAEGGLISSAWWGAALVEDDPRMTRGTLIARDMRVREGWWKEVEEVCRAARLIRPLIQSKPGTTRDRLGRALRSVTESIASYLAATTTNRRQARDLLERWRAWHDVRLSISGEDLKRLGIPPGPVYRRLLEGLREAVVGGVVEPGRETERAWVKKHAGMSR